MLIYIGSAIITLWGLSHLLPTRNVVKGFGELTPDNRRIITMEWIMEGLAMIFIGVLVFYVAMMEGMPIGAAKRIIYVAAGMLVVMAVVSLFTGARTSIWPMRLCPAVKTLVAALYWTAAASSG